MVDIDTSRFLLDANIFIEAHRRYYAQDLCPGFWECLLHYNRERRIFSIDRVRDELVSGQDDLSEWVRQAADDLFASSVDEEVMGAFGDIMNWVQGNNQFLPAAKEEFASVADGWVVAYASVHHAVVVTHEMFNANIRKRVPIPNVCNQFNVAYCNTFAMLRQLSVRFEWPLPAALGPRN